MLKRAVEVAPPRHPALRPYSSTAGRLPGTLLSGLMLHRPDLPWKQWTPERIQAARRIARAMSARYDLGEDTLLSLGSARPLRQLARVWKRKDTSLPTKALGTVASPLSALVGTALRSSHYDPWSDTAVAYDPEEAIEGHELGHAADFQGRRAKALYMLARALPGVDLYQENLASQLAMGGTEGEDLTEEERERRRNLLQRAFGTYMGGTAAKLTGGQAFPLAAAGAMLGRMGVAPGFKADEKKLRRMGQKIRERREATEEASTARRLAGLA